MFEKKAEQLTKTENKPRGKGKMHYWKSHLTTCVQGNILHEFLSSADIFQNLPNQLFKKFFHDPSECKTAWNRIRPDITSGLIWVQIDCKGYQQMAPAGIKRKWLFLIITGIENSGHIV